MVLPVTTKKDEKILLVEDDDDVVWAVNALLTMKGYDIDISKTGLDAMRKTKRKVYNLAIIDIKLPDMDGVELLKKFEESFPVMRKIIMTGHATKDNAIQALNCGADLFLTKPVNLQEFVGAVESQFRKLEEESKSPSPQKNKK